MGWSLILGPYKRAALYKCWAQFDESYCSDIAHHVCHLALDELEVPDRLPELLSLVRVLPRHVAGGLQCTKFIRDKLIFCTERIG